MCELFWFHPADEPADEQRVCGRGMGVRSRKGFADMQRVCHSAMGVRSSKEVADKQRVCDFAKVLLTGKGCAI